MARIVVYSMAYRGDVHPFVPIASELSRRGHEVVFVVPREFHAEMAGEPFRCAHSGSDFSPSTLDTHGEWLATWGMRLGGAGLLRLYLGELTVPHLDEMFDALHAELSGADLLVTHPAAVLVGSMVAEACDVPYICGDLFPMLVPTATAPPAPVIPDLGPRVNRLLWRPMSSPSMPSQLTYIRHFADFRRSRGLDARRRSMMEARLSPHLNLGLVSPHYLPPAPDWPSNYELTGFTAWTGPTSPLAEEVDTFIEAGTPPVLVTLGTLAASTHPERFEAAIRAVLGAGHRALVLCSNEANADRLERSGVLRSGEAAAWPFVPLAPLLPRCRAVVHSGAMGTTTMALSAGLPAVASPAVFDQIWHAKQLEQLGVGLHAPKQRDLRRAIEAMLVDEAMASRAALLGRRISAEDGVGTTVDRIGDFLQRSA